MSERLKKDVFEKLIRDILIILNYNPDQFNYEDSKGIIEIEIKNDLKAIFYLSSLQENQRFLSNKFSAPIDTLPDPETGKPAYELAIVTNFDTWFFYFDGREIYVVSTDRIENEFETIKALISKESIESGKFNEILNEITTRWLTRFLSLKLAEDSGINFNFTLRDIRRSFELSGKVAKPNFATG